MSPSTVDRVTRVLVEAAGVDETVAVDRDTPLIGRGLSLDSVAVLEMLLGLEKEFGIPLDPDGLLAAQALRTVGTLADYLDAQATEGG
jgi:acyl carrier protein